MVRALVPETKGGELESGQDPRHDSYIVLINITPVHLVGPILGHLFVYITRFSCQWMSW